MTDPSLRVEPLLNKPPSQEGLKLVDRLRDGGLFGILSWAEIEVLCREAADKIDELQAGVEGLRRDLNDLLKAANYKPDSMDRCRDLVLKDVSGMRPAMVEARQRLQDFQSDALNWQLFCAEEEHDKGETLLLRIWKQRKAAVAALARAVETMGIGAEAAFDAHTRALAAEYALSRHPSFNDATDAAEREYTANEQRVSDYIQEVTKGQIGSGDDPIGFLIASHAALVTAVRSLKLPDYRGGEAVSERNSTQKDGSR